MLEAVWNIVRGAAVEEEEGQGEEKAASTEGRDEMSVLINWTLDASPVVKSLRVGGRISNIRIFSGSSPLINK